MSIFYWILVTSRVKGNIREKNRFNVELVTTATALLIRVDG